MWFVLIEWAEGLDIVKEQFHTHQEAQEYLARKATVDGPRYMIVNGKGWRQLTSNPSWEDRP